MSTGTPSSIEPLLVEGNVNVGKDKGTGILLLTSHSVFALRTHMGAAATGAAAGGLIGALIGAWIDKKKANKREPSKHMEDPEILALPEKMLKKVKPCSLLIKAAIDETLLIKRTKIGYRSRSTAKTSR